MIKAYRQRGWATVRVHPLGKNPIGDEWQRRIDEPESFQPGENVGVRLGDPSQGLIDVDLDCPEGVALAPSFLPATATFGRPGKPRSHWIYQCRGVKTKKPKRTHIELRSTKIQTVFPPSIHETGEPITWTDETPVAMISDATLLASFGRLCAATVLARVWPTLQGDKHDTVLALSGALHHTGWPLEAALTMLLPAMELDGSSEPHREDAIRDTWGDHDRPRYGWPTVAELLGPLDAKAFQRGVELVPMLKPEVLVDAAGVELRPLTDLGNAERLIDEHKDELRYVDGLGWLEWTGSLWKPTVAPVGRMATTVRRLQQFGTAQGKPQIYKWGYGSESAGRIRAALAFAKDSTEIQSGPADFDRCAWDLCVPNGVVDLRTGVLREHAATDRITKVAGVRYDPSAMAPRFAQFLSEVFCTDDELARFVLRFLGYALTGSVKEQVFQVWIGSGANGKSVLLDTVRYVLGDYAQVLSSDLLIQRRNNRASEAPSPDVARLRGSRFAAGTESEEGQRWDEPRLKQLTGADGIVARHLHKEPFEFDPSFKLVLAVNHKPAVRGTDHGIWRRMQLVPFDAKFEGPTMDRDLGEKLRAEGPGVLAMLVASCLEWQRVGLAPPQKVLDASAAYRQNQDVVGQFLSECVELAEGKTASRSKLYQVYRKWCADSGEYMLGKHTFNNRLRERGCEEQRTHNEVLWRGMALRSDARFGAVG